MVAFSPKVAHLPTPPKIGKEECADEDEDEGVHSIVGVVKKTPVLSMLISVHFIFLCIGVDCNLHLLFCV